jgi:poly-gamma-glutamate synthesis protein (capsule biosynthesis protein)
MRRRELLFGTAGALASLLAPRSPGAAVMPGRSGNHETTLFLCGDVMTGRAIDQILPRPSDPVLLEPWIKNAADYVSLAERENGPIPRPVAPEYIWGDAIAVLKDVRPELRIVNLETAITTSDAAWPDKRLHYRMHPENVSCLTAAGIDCCALSNNHVVDWDYAGLEETLATLSRTGIRFAGAGRNRDEAGAPAVFELPAKGRVLVFSIGSGTSGIPPEWEAGPGKAGLALISESRDDAAEMMAGRIGIYRKPGDLVVVSVHWGSNWGYAVPPEQRRFAHALIDAGAADVIHGHSSHHPRPIEVYRDRLILYGCGDFINDYEGIRNHREYRGDLSVMYFPSFWKGSLARLLMVPMRIRRFQTVHASRSEAEWMQETLNRECLPFGSRFSFTEDGRFELQTS